MSETAYQDAIRRVLKALNVNQPNIRPLRFGCSIPNHISVAEVRRLVQEVNKLGWSVTFADQRRSMTNVAWQFTFTRTVLDDLAAEAL